MTVARASGGSAPSPASVAAGEAREARRRQILEAAKQVFFESGYHEASINAIIERARIARGTFYLYFESKAAVFDALLDQAMTGLRARITRIDVGPDAPPPYVQLREGLVRVLDYVLGDRLLATLLLTGAKAPEAEAAARAEVFFEDVRKVIRVALHHGLELKLVRPCNIDVTAAALLGTVRGVIEYVVTAEASPPVDEVVNDLIAVALRGVLA